MRHLIMSVFFVANVGQLYSQELDVLLDEKVRSEARREAESKMLDFIDQLSNLPKIYAVKSVVERVDLKGTGVAMGSTEQILLRDNKAQRWRVFESGHLNGEKQEVDWYFDGRQIWHRDSGAYRGTVKVAQPTWVMSEAPYSILDPLSVWTCSPIWGSVPESLKRKECEILADLDCISAVRSNATLEALFSRIEDVKRINRVMSFRFMKNESYPSRVVSYPSQIGGFNRSKAIEASKSFRAVTDIKWIQYDAKKKYKVPKEISMTCKNSKSGTDYELRIFSMWIFEYDIPNKFFVDPRKDSTVVLTDLSFGKGK